ncbi:hypothetical protein F441_14877 [Phytophthora nicotianae CJ01A1]|uniref:Uncharacterized protein n=4 Tax=Phytophthora nicotianae TaxID=4792 RepID=V9EJB1_PHYNI|nr:hypothetical protein F443_15073 [Phytophthora nicotianae P1569]ETO58717.1 hypothetical protein F444_22902 [Phytophthora nicotianae P1976]ETO68062.1 hypothetical protein F444_15056 [Phytophthora nicotianae P1976]ETP09243.1 hypothetical protein F441_14877 [Phytophthora nicotianae CJ01A1]ETP37268.1 hypothetical protein F442_14901 [Phytophthora nicotianae P10297]
MTETRRARSVNRQLKIAYNALGIEDDDVSNEDYELEAISEDDEEEDEDEDLSCGDPNEGSTTAAGKPRAQGNKNKKTQGNVTPDLKATKTLL